MSDRSSPLGVRGQLERLPGSRNLSSGEKRFPTTDIANRPGHGKIRKLCQVQLQRPNPSVNNRCDRSFANRGGVPQLVAEPRKSTSKVLSNSLVPAAGKFRHVVGGTSCLAGVWRNLLPVDVILAEIMARRGGGVVMPANELVPNPSQWRNIGPVTRHGVSSCQPSRVELPW
jgi:hypothetical protein